MSYLQMEGLMDDLILKVNWLATLLGAALAHLVGWAWYSQTFFGSRWAAGLGIKYDRKMPVVLMMQQLAGLLLVSWFVAASVAAELLMLSLLGTFGFCVQNYAGEGFARHPRAVKLINGGYWVAAVLVMRLVHLLFGAL